MLRFPSTAVGLGVGLLMLNPSARCQADPSQQDPTFEVASVRLTAPGPSSTVMEGGLGNGRIRYTSINLRNLLASAYGVGYYFVVGPAWLEDVRLDIAATFPPGTSKGQFRLMLLHLLEERLGLIAHLGSKPTDGYALVVADSGPRLEPAAAEAATADQSLLPELSPPAPRPSDEDGFPVTSAGPGVHKVCIPGIQGVVCRFRATSASVEELANQLPCGCRIPDETHLPGRYKFVLTAHMPVTANAQHPESVEADRPSSNLLLGVMGAQPPAREQSFPDIFHALEKQLGLKLERKKAPTPVVYVDHIERTPTEN